MKRIYPLFLFLAIAIVKTNAQNPTPNAGFENWTKNSNGSGGYYYTPDGWANLNPQTSFLGALTCLQCDTAHSGNYAVELVTDTIKNEPPVDGIITTGSIDILTQNVAGGIPFTNRPDSIYGWLRYYPTKGDSTEIQFDLFDSKRNTVGVANYTIGNTITTYTRFSAPIIYNDSTTTPDTSIWIISSSNGHNAFIGSRLYVDDIGIVFATGIQTSALKPVNISIVPNPATDYIVINNPDYINGIITLFTETGTEVRQFKLTDTRQNLDVHDLAAGNYLYTVTNTFNEKVFSGKIILK